MKNGREGGRERESGGIMEMVESDSTKGAGEEVKL